MLVIKDENGASFPAWKEYKLSDLLIERKLKSPKDGSYEHVSLTKEGVVPKSDRYERDFLVKSDDKEYKVTLLNDICYNPANLKFGVICRNKYGDAIFSPIYITFETTDLIIPEFAEIMVTRTDFINYSLKYQQGTVYERMAVSPEDLLQIKVKIPSIEEQKKLISIIQIIDERIACQNEIIESYQKQKKGLEQQLFSQELRFSDNGAKYPDWESIQFGELFQILKNNTLSRDELNYDGGEVKNIHYGDILVKYGATTEYTDPEIPYITNSEQLRKPDYIQNGDIIIADTAEDLTVGKATEIMNITGKVVSGLHTIACRPNMEFVKGYLGYYINSSNFHDQIIPYIAGTKVSGISKTNIALSTIYYPCMKEQEKIVDCFMTMDKKIKTETELLHQFETLRKSVIQNIFEQ